MAEGDASGVNQDLDQLHDLLVAANQKLNDQLGTTTDPDIAQTIVTEMRELLHRIDLVQSLLFTAASDRITAAVKQVQDANNDLTKSLQTINNITTLVTTVSNFLTLVDTAIDLAKTL